MGTWKTMHLRRISHTPGTINIHGGGLSGEFQTQALLSRAVEKREVRTRKQEIHNNNYAIFFYSFAYISQAITFFVHFSKGQKVVFFCFVIFEKMGSCHLRVRNSKKQLCYRFAQGYPTFEVVSE